MTAIELQTLIKEGQSFNIIDVRSDVKYDTYHLPGAINVPKGEMFANPEKYVDKNTKYYITCNSGNSAGMIAKNLKALGYNIESIEGGMSTVFTKETA